MWDYPCEDGKIVGHQSFDEDSHDHLTFHSITLLDHFINFSDDIV
jgi:hypothetical protein